MKKMTFEELNQNAMQIILHAGDCRKLLNDAIEALCNDANALEIDELMNEAKKEITIAHRIQTTTIQETIEDEEQKTCLLFSHAQDTLMTINSELNITKNLIMIYRKIENKV